MLARLGRPPHAFGDGPLQLRRRDDPAEAQTDQPADQRAEHLGRPLLDDEHRGPGHGEVADQSSDRPGHLGRQAKKGFVEQQDPGRCQCGAGERQLPLLTAGERAGHLGGAGGKHREAAEESLDVI